MVWCFWRQDRIILLLRKSRWSWKKWIQNTEDGDRKKCMFHVFLKISYNTHYKIRVTLISTFISIWILNANKTSHFDPADGQYFVVKWRVTDVWIRRFPSIICQIGYLSRIEKKKEVNRWGSVYSKCNRVQGGMY